MKTEDIMTYLTSHGVKPSQQRIAVMGYLLSHHTHPTVDDIYTALLPEMPTLSRTTVYNTLRLFVEKGAANQLAIDERNACFEAEPEPHAHFRCTRCGKIYDVPLYIHDLDKIAHVPEGFETDQAALYFKGICKDCLIAMATPDTDKNSI